VSAFGTFRVGPAVVTRPAMAFEIPIRFAAS